MRFRIQTFIFLVILGCLAASGFAEVGRSFAWIGQRRAQFTDAQLKDLSRHPYVVFTKFHDDYSLASQEAACKKVKAYNPNAKVFLYYSARCWFDRPNYYTGFQPSKWAMRDLTGNVVYFKADDIDPDGVATMVDNSQDRYRSFALQKIGDEFRRAPFDGVAFDAALPLAQGTAYTSDTATFGLAKCTAWNDGLLSLMGEFRKKFPGKLILYNGISPWKKRVNNRNLGLLDFADIAMDEGFCIGMTGTIGYLQEDWDLMSAQAARPKVLLMKSNSIDAATSLLGAYAYANFLMGYVPGSSYFKFGPSYTELELTSDPAEVSLPIGDPVAPHVGAADGVVSRDFTNGLVAVNNGLAGGFFTAPRTLNRYIDGVKVAVMKPGESILLAPQETAFFLNAEVNP